MKKLTVLAFVLLGLLCGIHYSTYDKQSSSSFAPSIVTNNYSSSIALPSLPLKSLPWSVQSKTKTEELSNQLSIPQLFSDNICFTENKGQLETIYQLKLKDFDNIRFYTKGFGGTAYFSEEGIAIGFIKGRLDHVEQMNKEQEPTRLKMKKNKRHFESTGFTIRFAGHNKSVKLNGKQEQVAKMNYFRGNDPDRFITDIQSFHEIFYENLYDNIDLRYYLNEKQLNYDYIVKPGAKVSSIILQYEDVKSLNVSPKGELEIGTDWGILRDKKLYSYQLINGIKKEVNVSYKLLSNDRVGFEVLGNYNAKEALIIDPPTLTWSTFLGGNDPAANGYMHDIAMDLAGNIYGTGWYNDRFPLNGAFDGVFGGDEQIVFKLNAAGTTLMYSSFIGGGNLDYAFGIDVDGTGNAYVAGYTNSVDFPTVTPVRAANAGNMDITVCKINAAGNALLYSTYYGGTGDDRAWGIAVNGTGEAYITGSTTSASAMATGGAYQTVFGGGTYDAFILKLNTAGTAVQYCTYYGGSGDDLGRDIDVNAAGNAYIAGATNSSNAIASAGSFDVTFGGGTADGFVAAINNAGNGRVYGAYAGGISEDKVEEIVLKGNGEAVLFGYTRSYAGAGGFPVVSAFQANNGAPAGGPRDAFMMRVNATGTTLLNSTFLGTAAEEMSRNPTPFDMNTQHKSGGVSVSDGGDIAIAITTDATTLPTVASVDPTFNGDGGAPAGLGDAYIAVFTPAGNVLSFTTYLGGFQHDYPTAGVRFDPSNNSCLVIAGSNHSNQATFPTTAGAYMISRGANTTNDQGFVTKYCEVILPVTLLSFTAQLTDQQQVLVEWSTATEENNHYFEVQRSSNGFDFETIGIVYGAGNSNQVLSYSLTDEEPFMGTSYYRLRQVDFDGRFQYSKIVSVDISTLQQLSISPNPTYNSITIYNMFSCSDLVEISLNNVIGQHLLLVKEEVSKGVYQKQIDLTQYPSGTYLLTVKTRTGYKVEKIVKQ